MPSNHLILFRLLLLQHSIFSNIRSFLVSQLFTSGGQSIGVSASASLCPMNIQDWFPLEWAGWLFLQPKVLSGVFINTTIKSINIWCSVFFTVQLSHPYMTTGKNIALTRWTFVGKVMSLLFNMLSRLVIAFLPKSKHLSISWLLLFWTLSKQWNQPSNFYNNIFGIMVTLVKDCFSFCEFMLTWFQMNNSKGARTNKASSFSSVSSMWGGSICHVHK